MAKPNPAFFMFDTRITDPQALVPYLEKVGPTIQAAGGRLIVQNDAAEVFEGQKPQGIVVILQFDSMQAARDWYLGDAYQQILPHRLAGASANAWLVEGLPLQA